MKLYRENECYDITIKINCNMDFATIRDLSLDRPWPLNTTQYIEKNFKILFGKKRFVKFN